MDADTARHRLLTERRRLEETIAAARSIGHTNDGGSDAEPREVQVGDYGSDDAAERETAAALQRSVAADLRRVDAALTRLEGGSYGACEVCRGAVEDDRLEILPAARTCIEHRDMESHLPS